MSLESLPDTELPVHFAREILDGLARLHQTVLVFDAHGRVVWQKDSAGLLPKLPHGGMSCSQISPVVDSHRYSELRERLAAGSAIVNERVVLEASDGTPFPVELSLTRSSEGQDSPHVIALLRPLADREQRDRQLRHTIEYLGAILDAAPESVLAVDPDGFVTYANPAIERLLGYLPEEMIDRPISSFVRNLGELDRIAGVMRGGSDPVTQDLDLRRKDEASVRVSVSASALRLPEGSQSGAVLMLHDVTERRRFEADLTRKNIELENYVHTVSHDLRSPLVALLGFTRLLRQDYGDRLEDKGRHFLERVEQAGRTMEALTNDLLELSRIGDRSERKALVDPSRVLSIVHAELKPRIEEHGVHLELPESAPLVLCDRTRLYQIFANLIGNALDHMGSVEDPRIRIAVEELPAAHVLSVSDNGRGVDPAHHERIFEIFQSLGPRRDGRRGTGVGLAIVRKIAETHGGRVWVESAPGGGATFRVLLPRG